jgi:hypothetical protein
MENKIINRLTKLQEHIQRYNQLLSQLDKEIKPSLRQPLILQLSASKKRIGMLKAEIHSLVHAPILEITYQISGNTYYARLTNVSKSEATGLINMLAQLNGQTVNFLEIKEITTFLCESKL